MECCSILCFLNEASFPCMQMSCCRQLVFCEAVFYFGDKRPQDLFNRPLSLSMDLLAPNFSVGSGEGKTGEINMDTTASRPSGQGSGNEARQRWLQSGASAGPCVPSGEKAPAGFGALYLAPLSSEKIQDLSISWSPAGHTGWYQRKGDILRPAHVESH